MLRRRNASPAPSVLLVSHGSDFMGGGEFGFRDIMLGIREMRPDLALVAVYPRRGGMTADAAQLGVRVEIAPVPWWIYATGRVSIIKTLGRPVLLLTATLQAIWLLARIRPTFVLTNTMASPSYAFAAKLLGIPHYWMVREFGSDDHGLRFVLGYSRTVRLIGWLSTFVICNSRAVEKAMRAVEPRMKTCVLYPVIDTPEGTPPERRPGDPFRAVLVGRFNVSKGQHIAIEAVAAARKAGVDMELTLVGAGSPEPLRELARRLEVEDKVTIDGPTDDVGRYWSAAHVGLMCSRREAFGRVTVEAMGAGLPVCGTSAGGTLEIIDAGFNGLLSPPEDSMALAENLIALALDEDLRRRLASGAVQTARRFRRERFNDELAAILDLSRDLCSAKRNSIRTTHQN